MAASMVNNMALDCTGEPTVKHLTKEHYVPNMNISNTQISPFDIYAGCATGYLKGCFMSSRSHHNLNELERPHPSSEIKCMSWRNYNEEEILTAQRDNSIIHYSLRHNKSALVPLDLPNEPGFIRCLKSHGHLIFAAFSKGLIKCQFVDTEDTLRKEDTEYKNIDAGPDLFCMDHNRYMPSMILSGGKGNPLKIWDISNSETPVFISKNVKNDWLNLTVPIWDTKAEFFSQSNKVVTGTAKAHVRLYDPSSTQRRPVIDIDTKEKSPITSLAVRPGTDYHVIAGTGKGSLFLVDIRKNSVVRHYKGVKGGVTDVKFHPSLPFFATSSIDRHIYCFDPDAQKQTKVSSIYVVSQVNCILFSSLWSSTSHKAQQDDSKSNTTTSADGVRKSEEEKSLFLADSDNDDDKELWESMSVVKTKRKTSGCEPILKVKKKMKN